MGNAEAHYQLGCSYGEGVGVRVRDDDKAVYHYEKASIGGHPDARYNLACYEEIGSMERAVKHWIIAANLGDDKSMKELLSSYKNGFITKEKYGATLRAHQAAINATKSAERDFAEEAIRTKTHPATFH